MGFIQGNTGNAVPCVIAFPGNVTAGSILVASARVVAGGNATCTDTLGNIWLKAIPDIPLDAVATNYLVVFYCLRAKAGACTVTIAQAGASFIRGAIGEWAGSIYNSVDVISAPATGTSNVSTANPVTSRGASGLAILCAAQASIASTFATAGGGYTTRVNNQAVANDIAMADQLTTPGTYTGTMTYSGSVIFENIQLIFYASQPVGFNKWTPTGQLNLVGNTRMGNPNVIYDSNPVILAGPNVYKMWCSPSSNGQGIYYFESADGVSDWHAYSGNPIIAAPCAVPQVYKVGSLFYIYTSTTGTFQNAKVFTSADGVTSLVDHGNILGVGGGGSFDSAGVAQPVLADIIGGVWNFYYQGIDGSGQGRVGHATSPDGITPFTKDPANPIVTGPSNAFTSFNRIFKIGSTYYCHSTMEVPNAKLLVGGLTSFYRWSAPAVTGPWTLLSSSGTPVSVYYPATPQDFHVASIMVNSSQIGDICMIDGADGHARLYYTLGDSFGQEYQVNSAIAFNTTLAQLISGFEGVLNAPFFGIPTLNLGAFSSDNFTRANANPIGAPWTPLAAGGGFGTAQIAGNLLEPSVAGTAGDSWYSGISGFQWSKVTVANASASASSSVGCDVMMNISGVATAYRLFWASASGIGNSGTLQLIRTVAGANTVLAQLTNLILSVGDTLSLVIAQNSQLLIYWNDYLIYAVTDPYLTSGNPGFLVNANAAVANAQLSAWNGGNAFQAAPPVTPSGAYSVPDCRVPPAGPNSSRTVQGTKIYDVQTSSNPSVPSKDSRVAPNIFIDSRVSPNIPQNSRTPGIYGPGVN